MTRTPEDPAASACSPVAPGAAPSQGGPGLSRTVERPGGKTSPHDRGQVTAGTPVPGSGARVEPSPGRGRAQDPAGTGTDRPVRETESTVPAGLQGAEWRKQVKAATSALHAAQRRRAGRYTRIADRSAGSRYVPGGNRRAAPGKPDGGDAA